MSAIKYTLAKDSTALAKQVDNAISSVKKGRLDVQRAAVSIINHANKCGDYSQATRLVEECGNAINGDALVEWFVVYGGLKVDKKEGFNGWSGKEFIKDKFQDAKAKMWWELKKKNPFAGYDFDKEILRLLSQRAKLQERLDDMTEEEASKVDMEVSSATRQQMLLALEQA